MRRSTILNLLLFFFTLVIIYLIFGIYGIYDIKKNNHLLFFSNDTYKFHKKYSQKLHHLRDSNRWGNNPNNYLFSVINLEENLNETLLLQGDSWIESISEIKESNDLLKNFAKSKNYNLFNAGITSYAPSAMHMQYKILKNDFKISPSILVIYIDQTDIGDEFCRYKHNKVYSSTGEFLHIKNEKYNKAIYDYTKIYEYSDLKFKGNNFIILKYPFIKIRYFFKRNFFQLKQIMQYGISDRNIKKCSFENIQKELFDYNSESIENFNLILKEYFEFLKKEKSIKNILIVSFPHINNQKKIYKINVSNLIDSFLKSHNDDRISHLNMSKMNFDNYNFNEIYKKDLASHLKNEYHTNIFIKTILNKLSNY